MSGLVGRMNVTGGCDYVQGLFWECVLAESTRHSGVAIFGLDSR